VINVNVLTDCVWLQAKDSLALHWYEWDTLGYKEGSNNTECATEVTCGFDTHYPECKYTSNHSWTNQAPEELGSIKRRNLF
jgi:hypothetical protein